MYQINILYKLIITTLIVCSHFTQHRRCVDNLLDMLTYVMFDSAAQKQPHVTLVTYYDLKATFIHYDND